ncbi:MAG: hypothetical protein DRJ69_04670 [Thermoprotei archaeon]|nr:MAG: hypothetical protein DRJ69_04670 [Thermoprotei archaeon]
MSERYWQLSAKYLAEGKALFEKGGLQQASEKLWGAAAQAIKAVAEAKGWPHYKHRELVEAVSKLFKETKDVELLRLRDSAEALHSNFYEGFMSSEEVQLRIADVERLVEKLRKLIA